MPLCPCRFCLARRVDRRERISGILYRLHLHRFQGWWDSGTDSFARRLADHDEQGGTA